jgi:hypothetical protein
MGAEHALAGIRAGLEPFVGQCRIAPVARHQVRASDMKDTRFAVRHRLAGLVEHERLGARDRASDRRWLGPDQVRLEKGERALGLSVHPVEARIREEALNAVVESRWKPGRGVREAADRLVGAGVPHAEERGVHGRHGSEDSGALRVHALERAAGKGEASLEQKRPAQTSGEQELAEPVRVGEREDVQDSGIGVEPEVLGDAADDEHQSLWLSITPSASRRAGRVDDAARGWQAVLGSRAAAR